MFKKEKNAFFYRRRPPPNLMAGLVAGVTNFAINILGKFIVNKYCLLLQNILVVINVTFN